MGRRDKVNYYLDLAEVVSQRCTCIRRHYGAVIVKNDEVISTGYVGAPRGRKNCSDIGECIRTKMKIPRGEWWELKWTAVLILKIRAVVLCVSVW